MTGLPSRSERRDSPSSPFGLRRGSLHSLALAKSGGADRDRTDDLMLAKHVLSQLSYSPLRSSLANARRLKSGGPGKI